MARKEAVSSVLKEPRLICGDDMHACTSFRTFFSFINNYNYSELFFELHAV